MDSFLHDIKVNLFILWKTLEPQTLRSGAEEIETFVLQTVQYSETVYREVGEQY